MKKNIKLLVLLLLFTHIAFGNMQSIPCQSSASMFSGLPTEMKLLNLKTGSMTNTTHSLNTTELNAVGYNKKDGFIWGVDQISANGTLIKVGLDNNGNYVSEKIKIANETFESYIGDIDDNGHLFIKTGDKSTNKVIVIDLDPNSNNYLKKIKRFSLSNNIIIHDWAFNPIDDFLYAVEKKTNKLYKIDPDDGTVTSLGNTGINETQNIGAAFFDKDGNLYVYANQSGKIYKISVANSPTASLFSTTDIVKRNDGAMCTDIEISSPSFCGDGIVQMGSNSFNKLTPEMLGITQAGINLSGTDVDVSSSFNLDAGSILVSYSSVDVRNKDGNLLFNLQHEGDQNANWTVKYSSAHKLQLAHGGALMGKKEDWFTSADNKLYTFKSQLKNGLSHSISGNTYRVKNSTNSKIWNSDFLWESNTVANTFTFEFHSSAPSNVGKGSAYSIFLETSTGGEECDDGNNVSGDGCSESCQLETPTCGDGTLDPEELSFNKLTPQMLGITTAGINLSGTDVDVSSNFNLKAGSILVSYSSVDVRLKDGALIFNLQNEGDQNANWTVKYASARKLKLSHGGALMEQKEDWFTAADNKIYTFISQLTTGLTHSIVGNTYRVRNNTNNKIWDNNFLWESNTVANTFTFEFHSSAPSNAGKGSGYSIFLQTPIKSSFNKLTPAMLGITKASINLSGTDVDVSSNFNLKAGSILVSYSSVDVRLKDGNLLFNLQHEGDQNANWTVKYASARKLQIAHGGALMEKKEDWITSSDNKLYTFKSQLKSGLSHSISGNTYRVKNITKNKIWDNNFLWESNTVANTFTFEFHSSAPSNPGKGSGYSIFLETSIAEQCDDGNNISGDGCSESCQLEKATCGDGFLQAGTDELNRLMPNMLGISNAGINLSGTNVDVSSSFNLDAGSILVSYSSVDVRLKDGELIFNLQNEGDQNANWTIKYASPHKVRLLHGGALMEQKEDWITSSDNKLYTFKSQLKNGLSHSISGNTYRVKNSTNNKIWDNNFLWESNTVANTFTFEFHSSAPSNPDKGSGYGIFLETSDAEQCDDGNNISGDGCSESCEIEENSFHGYFNIERTNSKEQKVMSNERNAWYTQIVARDFDYSIVFYEDDFSAEKNLTNVTLKVELLNMDNNTTLYDYKFHIPENVVTSRIDISKEISDFFKTDLDKLPAIQNARFKVSYGVDVNNSIIQKDCLTNPQFCSNFATDYAKDNFAIRPESFYVTIADKDKERINSKDKSPKLSMSAGYDYNLSVMATKYNSTKASLGYTRVSNASFPFEKANITAWNNDNNITEAIKFVNGHYTNSKFHHNNVGHYTLTIPKDTNWTTVDQNKIEDCIPNSSITSLNGNEKSGCNIEQKSLPIALTYYPDHFEVDVTMHNLPSSGHDDFIYMNNLNTDNSVAISFQGTITAKSENNMTTTNFIAGGMATDLLLDLVASKISVEGDDSKPIQATDGTVVKFSQLIRFNQEDFPSSATELTSIGNQVSISKTKFLKENSGTLPFDMRYNLNKYLNTPINPVQVTFDKLTASSPKASSVSHQKLNPMHLPMGSTNFTNNKKQFYYAKVVSDKERYPRVNVTINPTIITPLNVDIYCKASTAYCADRDMHLNGSGLGTTRDQNGWFISTKHNGEFDGNVTELTKTVADTILTINNPNANIMLPNGHNLDISETFINCLNENDVTITIRTSPALAVIPNSTYQVSCTKNKPSTWTGTGETGHTISTSPNIDKSNRMSW